MWCCLVPVVGVGVWGLLPNCHCLFLFPPATKEVALQPAPGLTWRTIGGVLDFYIFLGPDPNMVIQQYQQVIGKCPHPNVAICGHLPHAPIPVSPQLHHHPQPSQLGRGQWSPAIPSPALPAYQGSAITYFPPLPFPSHPFETPLLSRDTPSVLLLSRCRFPSHATLLGARLPSLPLGLWIQQ